MYSSVYWRCANFESSSKQNIQCSLRRVIEWRNWLSKIDFHAFVFVCVQRFDMVNGMSKFVLMSLQLVLVCTYTAYTMHKMVKPEWNWTLDEKPNICGNGKIYEIIYFCMPLFYCARKIISIPFKCQWNRNCNSMQLIGAKNLYLIKCRN